MNSSLSTSFGRHPHRPHSVGSHDSSVSSSASSQTLVPPPSGMFAGPPPPPRSQPPPGALPQLHSVTRSPASTTLSVYGHPYGTSSTSPSTSSSVFQDPGGPGDGGYAAAGISPTHMSPGLSAQKRAYRQRRKDPSCDACRERKVKCDATETQSCSECATRSVKCQFTKETNRRMSSIKQVQDLQSQLADAKQELHQLRTALRETEGPILKLPEIRPSTERRVDLPILKDFEGARQNIRDYGKGVFKVPPLYRQLVKPAIMKNPERQLPAKPLVDRLLSQYYYSIHRLFPIIHWPTFAKQVEDMYANGSFEGIAQVWASMFYAVLACGTLQTLDTGSPTSPELKARPAIEGVDFMRASTRMVNTWTDEMSLDHARSSLLLAHYLTEMNMKSAGWVWLGSAIKIAQDIGLHVETGPWGMLEEEMRRRLWWCMYATDRLISLEGSRPPMINDEDCQVGWPCPVDDEMLQPGVMLKQPPGSGAHSSLATVIPVVRFISQLKTTLKSRIISPQMLRTYDDYFNAVMSTFPETFQIHSSTYLEPHNLTIAFFLQTARFHLYRHNLSIAVPTTERIEAMNRCRAVAKDTVRYISRTLQTPPSSPTPSGHRPSPRPFSEPDINVTRTDRWQGSVKSTALNLGCAHIWRCTLILCFRGDFQSALLLIRYSATVGELRSFNTACGRHLAFFLETLLGRWREGRGRQDLLQMDEEMIAYLSADLQGSTESGWVWTGSETGFRLNVNAETREPGSAGVRIEAPDTAKAGGYGGAARINGENPPPEYQEPPPPVPERVAGDPAIALLAKGKDLKVDWAHVERLLHELMEEQQRQQRGYEYEYGVPPESQRNQNLHYHQPAHNAGKRLQLAPPDAESPGRMANVLSPPQPPQIGRPPAQRERSQDGRERSEGASRFSIANII